MSAVIEVWGLTFVAAPANTVLADTGAVRVAREYEIRLYLSGSMGQEVVWEHRNAANDATLFSKTIPVTQAWLPVEIPPHTVNPGERIRVIARANVPAGRETQVAIVLSVPRPRV